jgi:hypothetical protein
VSKRRKTHMTIREKDLHGKRVWYIQYTVYTMRMVRKTKAKTIDPIPVAPVNSEAS